MILTTIFIYSVLMAIVYWGYSIQNIFSGEYKHFTISAGHALVLTIIGIDTFLRIWSPEYTGL